VELLDIGKFAVRPAADWPMGVAAELVRRMTVWAATNGRVVTLYPESDEVRGYYEGLGLRLTDWFGRSLVTVGHMLDTRRFRVIELEVDTREEDPQLTPLSAIIRQASESSVVHVPIRAAEVVGAWRDIAAAAEASSLEGNDQQRLRAIRLTQTTLSLMRVDIAARIPDYVFALATGPEVEDIQAIAIVTAQNGLWDDAEDRRTRTFEISQLLATPAPDQPPGLGSELVHRITVWAAANGGAVTLHPANDEVKAYYEGLGLRLTDWFGRPLVSVGYGLHMDRYFMVTLSS